MITKLDNKHKSEVYERARKYRGIVKKLFTIYYRPVLLHFMWITEVENRNAHGVLEEIIASA